MESEGIIDIRFDVLVGDIIVDTLGTKEENDADRLTSSREGADVARSRDDGATIQSEELFVAVLLRFVTF